MKRSTVLTAAAAIVLGVIAGRYLFPATASSSEHADHVAAAADAPAATTIWTCSMHPQIRQPEPGQCPICGMDLIPADDGSAADDSPRAMTMSASALALAEIQTTPVERRLPAVQVRLVGQLDFDETRQRSLTARFPARVDQLFVNYTGIAVGAGEHLARVYSPELLTAQRELLTAYRNDPDGSLTRLAREKLRLWNLLPAQIEALLARGEPDEAFEIRAPIGGIVTTKAVSEGDYVKTGEPLFRIADLDTLWLHLEAYESDLAWLRFGQDVAFQVEAWPGETFHGRISFIAPEVDRRTRTTAIRVNVPNPGHRLKPGMLARGEVSAVLGGDATVIVPDLAGKWISPMHPEIIKDGPGSCDICGMDLVPADTFAQLATATDTPPLVVPTSAVLRTGRRAVVYVQVPDREQPTFEGREVVLGPKAGDVYLVTSGLTEGDQVVTHGAFKIDSALQIAAKPSMMNPPESADADHGEMHMTMGDAATELSIAPDLAAQILPAYFALQDALTRDALADAQAALRDMMAITGHQGPLPALIHTLLDADDIEAQRRPHFETLSNALIAAIRQAPAQFTGEIHLMHCPMVYEDRGAVWLQPSADLRNPYFGDMMLTCGEDQGVLNP